MGVIEHGGANDVGHLGEAAVVGLLHGMENAALHGLEAIVDVGHRAVQNHIRGIVNPVVAKHTVERQRTALAHWLFGLRYGDHALLPFRLFVHYLVFVHTLQNKVQNYTYFLT